MKIRAIDYLANPGGGVRFTVELVKGLAARSRDARIEVVSYGPALETYRAALRREGVDIPTVALAPTGYWRTLPARRVLGIPGTGGVKRWIGYDSRWYFEVPRSALDRCDVVWFPWMHRHRLPRDRGHHVVGSFHDAIVFLWPRLVSRAQLEDERETLERWLASPARLAVSSATTVQVMAERFHMSPDRVTVIPLSGSHVKVRTRRAVPRWSWQSDPFLLCPANTSPHKNHEVLFEGYARWGATIPLVLTGYGTDLPQAEVRGRSLRQLAAARGVEVGPSIVPLGYVDDDVYYDLLSRAWAIIMPSLLEGGGSFPVMEAMLLGVPVICADIAVLREQMARMGGEVLWFDPRNPLELVERLDELLGHYDEWRTRARAQVHQLRRRTWQDVAGDYWSLFQAARRG